MSSTTPAQAQARTTKFSYDVANSSSTSSTLEGYTIAYSLLKGTSSDLPILVFSHRKPLSCLTYTNTRG
ncbi:vacuolar assembling protein VPS41 [Pseudohyphozyma bogoriensis]|nr:vacuolar assembling protein VPS41 [Pseudohyphozyma bogoriensis]